MKIITRLLSIFTIAILFYSSTHAQSCKIRISYDDNGYRVQRIKDCTSPRPSSTDSSDIALAVSDSLNKLAAGTFKVYPNPTEMNVNVLLDAVSLQSPCSLVITDATGRAFKSQILTGRITVIDLSGFADGTYYFRLQRGSTINTVKIAKVYGLSDIR